MELGEEPAVATAAKLAQEMAYQNKNFLQVGLAAEHTGVCPQDACWQASGAVSFAWCCLCFSPCLLANRHCSCACCSPAGGADCGGVGPARGRQRVRHPTRRHARQGALRCNEATSTGMQRSTLALLRILDVAAGVQGGVLVAVFCCCICVPTCCPTPTCPQVQVPFTIGGSGSAYIYGLCDKLWRVRAGCNLCAWWLRHALPNHCLSSIRPSSGLEVLKHAALSSRSHAHLCAPPAAAPTPLPQPNMTEEECQAFVVKAVSHAMARDGSSGGCIRTVVISKDGVKRRCGPGLALGTDARDGSAARWVQSGWCCTQG